MSPQKSINSPLMHKRYWLIPPIAFILLAIVSSTVWLLAIQGEFNWVAFLDVYIPEIIFWGMWGVATPVIFKLSRRFSYPLQPLSWKWIVHIPIAAVVITATYASYLGLYALHFQICAWAGFAIPGELGTQLSGRTISLLGFGLPLGYMVYGLLLGVSQITAHYDRLREEEKRSSALQTQLAQAELLALKMQLHPHFLFNSLNTISATLHVDKEAADKMITKLGDFLRLTLEHADRAMVLLEEEIDFCRRYLEIEKHRFEDQLDVTFNVSSEAEKAEVPYLILQPLVENAIKHGVSQSLDTGTIAITALCEGEALVVRIENSGPVAQHDEENVHYGIGLSNTVQRLQQQYGKAAGFLMEQNLAGLTQVTLRLPYTI